MYKLILALSFFKFAAGQTVQYNKIDKLFISTLSEADFVFLKSYLLKSSNEVLKDTVIIKYDFNNETCWNSLDEKDDTYIQNIISVNNNRIKSAKYFRPNISVFQYREAGTRFNKLKLWNSNIIIDSSRILRKYLFKKKVSCGSSVIIFPDRRFILLSPDPHFEILDMSEAKIKSL